MQSHFDNLKNDYKTSCLSYETVPKSNFAHTKVNIAGHAYNISNRLTLVSLNNEQQIINSETNWDPTKIPSWKSLRNLVELLPRFVGLKDLVRDFGSFASEWKDFFIQSFKEIREKDSDFPVLPGNAHQRLSAIETLILMKYLRPEELVNYINSFHSSVFKRTLTHGSRTNLDFLSRAALSKRPTVVFCDDRNSNIEELLELKAHLQKSAGGVGAFNCLNKSQETIGKELERSAQKGQWLVIVDFELLDAQSARLVIKKIGLETQNQKSSPNWKVWLIYRIGKRQKELDIGIRDFFSGCSRVFLNPPDNVKDQIASFYSVELQEFEKKSALRASKPQLTDFRALSSTERDIRLHRIKIPRKNDNCSLLCLIDRVDLAQKNSNFSVLLDKYSEKLRFRLCFVYSLIVERKKYELGVRRHRKIPLFELPHSEFQNLLDEIFTFLGLFSINPFIFLEKALVIEREHFEGPYSSFYVDQLVRKLLTEYVFVEIENQMVLDVKGFKYELFSAGAGLSNEEKVYKTLNGFPNEDPIELFGFNLNTEIMLNYRQSNKIMQAVLKQEEVHRKAEGLRSHVLRSLENIKFLEGEVEDENKTKSFEFLEGNIKEFLKFVLKIFLDNEKSKETLVDLTENILKAIGTPFQLKDCRVYLGIPAKSDDKNIDLMLMTWINEHATNDSSIKRSESFGRSPKYSLLSLDTESSEMFSEKFSFQKKSRGNFNLKYFMKPQALVMSPSTRKKHSQIEPFFGISEAANEDFQNSADLGHSDKRKRAATFIRKSNVEIDDQGFFRNFLANELQQANELIYVLRKDLQSLLDFLQGKTGFTGNVEEVFKGLKSNSIPENWWNLGFVLKDSTIYEFLKVFLLKKELLTTIVVQRKCEVLPVIPLGKLFDPFNFLLSFAWDTSSRKNISIYNLKFVLEKAKTLDQKQNLKNGVLVSGFVVRGGRVNESNFYLEDENIREFENALPIFVLSCRKKFVKYEKKSLKLQTFSFEIFDITSQWDFEDQYKLQSKTPMTFFHYQNKNISPSATTTTLKTAKMSIDGGEKTIYYVKIPIINPRNSSHAQQYGINLSFFFKSMKPQEYWIKKGTEIYLDVML